VALVGPSVAPDTEWVAGLESVAAGQAWAVVLVMEWAAQAWVVVVRVMDREVQA